MVQDTSKRSLRSFFSFMVRQYCWESEVNCYYSYKYLNNTKHSRLHVFVYICFWPEAVLHFSWICNKHNLATLVIHSTDNKLIFSQLIFCSYNLQYLTTNSGTIYHSTVYFYMQTVSICCLQIHSINRHWHSVFKSSVHISVIKG